jgi:hypothetical protein
MISRPRIGRRRWLRVLEQSSRGHSPNRVSRPFALLCGSSRFATVASFRVGAGMRIRKRGDVYGKLARPQWRAAPLKAGGEATVVADPAAFEVVVVDDWGHRRAVLDHEQLLRDGQPRAGRALPLARHAGVRGRRRGGASTNRPLGAVRGGGARAALRKSYWTGHAREVYRSGRGVRSLAQALEGCDAHGLGGRSRPTVI